MDQKLLKSRAEALKSLLETYSHIDSYAMTLLTQLSDLLQKALDEKINTSIDWREVPGHYIFSEHGLSKYRDLEDAYAKFKIEITGGEDDVLRALREARGK